jgi:hypothetical protein
LAWSVRGRWMHSERWASLKGDIPCCSRSEGVAWSRHIYVGGGLATYFRVIGDWWLVDELICTWQAGKHIYLRYDWSLNSTRESEMRCGRRCPAIIASIHLSICLLQPVSKSIRLHTNDSHRVLALARKAVARSNSHCRLGAAIFFGMTGFRAAITR